VGELPWKMMENSQFCIKGVFTEAGQLAFNLQPDSDSLNLNLHAAFRWVERFPQNVYMAHKNCYTKTWLMTAPNARST